MKVALFGAGRIGKVHAASIKMDPRSELVAVTDVMSEAAEALARDHGIAARSAEDILADSVDRRNPDRLLHQYPCRPDRGRREGGQGDLLRKADRPRSRRARWRSARLPQGHDKPMMMGFNRRFDPNFAAVKAALDAGEIGKGELLAVTSYDPAPPPVSYIKVSGGLYRDMMIHDFDMCSFLFGMPKR